MHNLFVWFPGLLVSVVLGHIGVKWLNFALRKYIGAEERLAKLTPTLGCIERVVYTVFMIFPNYHYVIVTLFSIKMAQRLITYTKITNDDELKKAGQHANVFVICNIASLCFGILGGALILYFRRK